MPEEGKPWTLDLLNPFKIINFFGDDPNIYGVPV
jgi:hypothetical protein